MTQVSSLLSTGAALFLAVACTVTSPASASDSTVNVTASIVASPCKVASDSVVEVDLGKVWTSELTDANDASKWVAFQINLVDCPVNTTQVTATMSGSPDPDFPDYYINTGSTDGSSSGKNVAIDVMDEAGLLQLSNGKTMTVNVDNSHAAVFNMKSRMITPTGKATSGKVAGAMEVTMTYQ